jgi:hypothetical protein
MSKIRDVLIILVMLLCPATSVFAHGNIRINLSVFPELVVVSGYPVYYAPELDANYFFYDGLYWIYQDDDWYSSYWYNGPWWLVYPEDVPVFILRIPVRYYLQPPVYFYGWRRDAPPRWGDHWGHDWDRHRRGWDRWDRRFVPQPAPPPVYQRQYSGDRYPRQVEQQYELHQRYYRYHPQDPAVQQRYQEQVAPRAPVQQQGQRTPEDRGIRQQDTQRYESPQRRDDDIRRSAPQQGRPEVDDQRRQQQPSQQQIQQPSSNQRAQQIPTSPPDTQGQQDVHAATRSQSPQKGGMNIERSAMPSARQERTESQNRRQQTEQGLDKHEQNKTRSESNEQQRDGNSRHEPEWRENEQRRGQGRYRHE